MIIFYGVLPTNATCTKEDILVKILNSSGLHWINWRIFFGSTKAVVRLELPDTDQTTLSTFQLNPNVLPQTTTQLAKLTDPTIINYGFNSDFFINSPLLKP